MVNQRDNESFKMKVRKRARLRSAVSRVYWRLPKEISWVIVDEIAFMSQEQLNRMMEWGAAADMREIFSTGHVAREWG